MTTALTKDEFTGPYWPYLTPKQREAALKLTNVRPPLAETWAI